MAKYPPQASTVCACCSSAIYWHRPNCSADPLKQARGELAAATQRAQAAEDQCRAALDECAAIEDSLTAAGIADDGLQERVCMLVCERDALAAHNAELVRVLRELLQLNTEQSGEVAVEDCRYLDLDCDGGHVPSCPVVKARAALASTPADAAARLGALEGVVEAAREHVEHAEPSAAIGARSPLRAALARLDAVEKRETHHG